MVVIILFFHFCTNVEQAFIIDNEKKNSGMGVCFFSSLVVASNSFSPMATWGKNSGVRVIKTYISYILTYDSRIALCMCFSAVSWLWC